MNRASPYPYCARDAHRGYSIPCRHCPSTSIQEFTWNSKSCPEGLPREKKGRITRNAAAITISRGKGKIDLPTRLTGSLCCFVCIRSREDEFGRELASATDLA